MSKSKADLEFEALVRKLDMVDLATSAGLINKTDSILDKIITLDPEMLRLKEVIKKLSNPEVNIPVLILGETGTGKELVAQALSVNRKGPFVPVNCAGIPDTLLESEFCGTVKGSFTGGIDRIGYIEEATDGTLFLDEIGDMPLLLQSKLLRILSTSKFRRVGDTKERQANCRFIAATNCEDLDRSNKFRKDLYYRLGATKITLPPLRSRANDIEYIVETFCKDEKIKKLILERVELMEAPKLPGNIRQLLNLIEESKILNS